MLCWNAIYRDEVTDRNPTREELVVEAPDLEAAIREARRHIRLGRLVEIHPMDGHSPAWHARRDDAAGLLTAG